MEHLKVFVLKIAHELYQHKLIYIGTLITFSAKFLSLIEQLTAVAQFISSIIAIVVGVLTIIRIILKWENK